MNMPDARYEAYKTLRMTEKDSKYVNISLSERNDLSERDFSLYQRLVRTAVERKITLDYNISIYLKNSIKKLKPQLLTVLRLGASQLLFMDKIPASAAVNESVKLAKKTGCSYASGLVNAVLRKISAEGIKYPDKDNEIYYLSVKYSFPEYAVKKYLDDYGPEICLKILESSLKEEPVYIRKNNLKEGNFSFPAEKSLVVPGAYKVSGNLFRNSDDLKNGLFHVQDLPSQICCLKLRAKPGDKVADVCASPGGKTAALAEIMENKGFILSCDIHPQRVKLIEENVKRLGIKIVKTSVKDASEGTVFDFDNEKHDLSGYFDKLLCDVPCSGSGDAGRKPDVKYKRKEDIENLPALQKRIISCSSRLLKSGGRMIYSTCSLYKDENEKVVNEFLSKNKNFSLIEMKTIFPFEYGTDGFFYAVIEKE